MGAVRKQSQRCLCFPAWGFCSFISGTLVFQETHSQSSMMPVEQCSAQMHCLVEACERTAGREKPPPRHLQLQLCQQFLVLSQDSNSSELCVADLVPSRPRVKVRIPCLCSPLEELTFNFFKAAAPALCSKPYQSWQLSFHFQKG